MKEGNWAEAYDALEERLLEPGRWTFSLPDEKPHETMQRLMNGGEGVYELPLKVRS